MNGLTGPFEIVEGDGPVCVDGVCLPNSADVAANPEVDLANSDSTITDIAPSSSVSES